MINKHKSDGHLGSQEGMLDVEKEVEKMRELTDE
jgi:hypothetical protein